MRSADTDIRARIVAEARCYLDVPFQHQGRAEHGEGIDCVGIVINVGNTLGLLQDFDVRNYARSPNPRIMRRHLYEQMDRIPIGATAPGDWYYMAFTRQPQHLALRTDRMIDGQPVPYILHCYSEAGRCVEHRLTPAWRRRIIEAYRYKGVT